MYFRISMLLFVSYFISIQGKILIDQRTPRSSGRSNFNQPASLVRRFEYSISNLNCQFDNLPFYSGFGYGGFNQMLLNAFKEENKSHDGHKSTFMNYDDFLKRPSRSPIYRFAI